MPARKKYNTEEERKRAIKVSKTFYMTNKPWYCPVCDITTNLAGKWSHLYTIKHNNKLQILLKEISIVKV